jgi:SAM-dependent methyltransferase
MIGVRGTGRPSRDDLVRETVALALEHERTDGGALPNLTTTRGAGRYVDAALLVAASVPEDATVLDVGCGAGQLTYLLSRLGVDAVAADITPEIPAFVAALRRETATAPDYVNLQDADWEEALGREFDAVCMYGVLEHVPDFGDFLRRVRSALAPDGLLFIFMFPNRTSWIEALNERIASLASDHPLRFSVRELSLMLRWSGFKVESVRYEDILPVNLVNVPGRLRRPLLRSCPVLAALSRGLVRTPGIRRLSTSFQIVARNAVNWS